MQFAAHRISYSAQICEPVAIGLSFASACNKAGNIHNILFSKFYDNNFAKIAGYHSASYICQIWIITTKALVENLTIKYQSCTCVQTY